jgi:hypothetical protein
MDTIVKKSAILRGLPNAALPTFVYTLGDALKSVQLSSSQADVELDEAFGDANWSLVAPILSAAQAGDEILLVIDGYPNPPAAIVGPLQAALTRGAMVLLTGPSEVTGPSQWPWALVNASADISQLAKRWADYDADGWSNCDERRGIVAPRSLDSRIEYVAIAKTKPWLSDSDGDGSSDGQEVEAPSRGEYQAWGW